MVTFSLRALFITHVLLLVLGPLVVTGLLGWVVVLSYKKTCEPLPPFPIEEQSSLVIIDSDSWRGRRTASP